MINVLYSFERGSELEYKSLYYWVILTIQKKTTIKYDYNMFAYRPGLCYCCKPEGLYDDVIKWFAMRI